MKVPVAFESFHPVGTLAFVVWCLYKIFWGVCLFCVSWILLQGSLKMLEGKGTEEDPQEQRWDHLLFIVLWTEWAIALCVCPLCYSTAWLAVKGSVNINPTWDTVCALYFHHFVFNKHERYEHWLEICKSVELMFLLHVLIWNLSSETIAVHVSACF